MNLNLMAFIQVISYLKNDGGYIISLDEYKPIGTHWILLYVNGDNGEASNDVTYFDSLRVEHIEI